MVTSPPSASRFQADGYREGFDEGTRVGLMEGRVHGASHGARVCAEVSPPPSAAVTGYSCIYRYLFTILIYYTYVSPDAETWSLFLDTCGRIKLNEVI